MKTRNSTSIATTIIVCLAMSWATGCALSGGPSESKDSGFSVDLRVSGTDAPAGEGNAAGRGLLDDPTVYSVRVTAYNSSKVSIGAADLMRATGFWKGTVTVSETGLCTFEALASDSSSVAMYKGWSDTLVTGLEDRVTITVQSLHGLAGEWLFDGEPVSPGGYDPYGKAAVGVSSAESRFVVPNSAYALSGSGFLPTTFQAASLNGTDFSIAVWLKTVQSDANSTILTTRNDNSASSLTLHNNDDGTLSFYMDDASSNPVTVASTVAINDGEWHFAVIVVDRDLKTEAIYIDGVLEGISSFEGYSMDFLDSPLGFGGMYYGSLYYYNGALDDCRIYTVALDAVRITALFQEGGYEPAAFLRMVPVPGGTFQMGSALEYTYEFPIHTVSVSSFNISKYEITQAQYARIVGDAPSNSYGIGDPYPVYYVTWYDAVEFCNKLSALEGRDSAYVITERTPSIGYPITSATVAMDPAKNGYRLPTEAEWEYAARGGSLSQGYAFSGSDTADAVSWNSGNSSTTTHPAGLKTANELGLRDMSGNVWEWCWDWYGSYPSEAHTDPTGAPSGMNRILRGGSWVSDSYGLNTLNRYFETPLYKNMDVGFRVLRR